MTTVFSESVIAEIEARDHRVFTVAADEWISDEIETRLEADGYVFACSPENPDGCILHARKGRVLCGPLAKLCRISIQFHHGLHNQRELATNVCVV